MAQLGKLQAQTLDLALGLDFRVSGSSGVGLGAQPSWECACPFPFHGVHSIFLPLSNK